MDTQDEQELEDIWRRVKRYIPTSRIMGRDQREILQSIENLMRDVGEVGDERGSMQRLVRQGFAKEEAFGRTNEFQSNFGKWLGEGVKTPIVPEPPVAKPPELAELPNVEVFESGRASIATRRGKLVYAQKNLSVAFSEFRGKRSYYIYNKRQKKRITWGLLDEERV